MLFGQAFSDILQILLFLPQPKGIYGVGTINLELNLEITKKVVGWLNVFIRGQKQKRLIYPSTIFQNFPELHRVNTVRSGIDNLEVLSDFIGRCNLGLTSGSREIRWFV